MCRRFCVPPKDLNGIPSLVPRILIACMLDQRHGHYSISPMALWPILNYTVLLLYRAISVIHLYLDAMLAVHFMLNIF